MNQTKPHRPKLPAIVFVYLALVGAMAFISVGFAAGF
jgi:hypothetical protein